MAAFLLKGNLLDWKKKINLIKLLRNHSQWFDVKWLIIEKPIDLDFFTVVVMGTRGRNVYNANVVILFTVQNDQYTYMYLHNF